MKRTGDFRSENRRAYAEEYRKEGGRESGRESGENIYRELTREGQRFCAAAGLLEEIVVLAVLRIDVRLAPIPVLAFMWVLFVILTAAALIGAAGLADRVAALWPLPESGKRRVMVYPAPACQTAAADGYSRGAEKIAA